MTSGEASLEGNVIKNGSKTVNIENIIQLVII